MRSKSNTLAAFLGVAMFASATLPGCQRVTVDQPALAQSLGSSFEDQLEFWHALTEQPLLTNNDALRGLLLFFDDEDETSDYNARVALCKQRGWLNETFDEDAQLAASRGTLATLLVRALDIKGGVTMRLWGVSPRYAIRELKYVGIYPPSSESQAFSGFEFVSLIGRVENYRNQIIENNNEGGGA